MKRKPLRPLILVIAGATATGKTRIALEIARRMQGYGLTEILNMDSVQVYRGLDIGTAKPTPAELLAVAHHLVDFMEAPHTMNASDYRKKAVQAIQDCERRGVSLVLVVGGTGFYLQALLKGMYPVQNPSDEVKRSVQRDLALKGLDFLYGELKTHDPEYAARLHSTDTYRISRGVEIVRTTGKMVTAIRKEFQKDELPWRVRQIGFRRPKEVLRQSVRLRTRQMIENGLLRETKDFLDRGLAAWGPLKSVGYKEAQMHLHGELTRDEMFEQIVHNTMQLAKRQSTWFRRDPDIIWFEPDFSEKAIFEYVRELAVSTTPGP